MSKPLPTRDFKWMDEDELENWKNISCVLEVGLVYPELLHPLLMIILLHQKKLRLEQ